jgi:hypothetical protein
MTDVRQSTATEPGRVIAVSGADWVEVCDDTDLDVGLAFILANNGAADATVRLEPAADANGGTPAVANEGVVLKPGGTWREENYAGALCALSAGTDLSLVIF